MSGSIFQELILKLQIKMEMLSITYGKNVENVY